MRNVMRRLKRIAPQKGRGNMKRKIISAWTAKPNSEKEVLQRGPQIHGMFSRDDGFHRSGRYTTIWPKATSTFTASPPHGKRVPRVPFPPCSEMHSLSATVIRINKTLIINTRQTSCARQRCKGSMKRKKERKRREGKGQAAKPASAQCLHPEAPSYILPQGSLSDKANLWSLSPLGPKRERTLLWMFHLW